jgi:hypothetical protein
MQRPTGVTILAVLEFIGGALGILGGCGLVGLGALGGATAVGGAAAGEAGRAAVAGGLGILGIGLGVFTIILSVVGLFIGYGLWTLKKWAWNAARILSIVSIVFSIIGILNSILGGQGADSSILSSAVTIAINAFIVYYLNKPEVKAAFA